MEIILQRNSEKMKIIVLSQPRTIEKIVYREC